MKKQLGGVAEWLLTVFFITFLLSVFPVGEASSSCSSPANPIEAENCLPGTPSSTWDIPSAVGDTTIQGFATDMSVNVGGTVHFKVNSNTSNYKLDIYRMGYYGGMGARKITTVNPIAFPQQPPCIYAALTGLTDCGNWMETASWDVPANAASGIYFAKAIRNDTGGASHIFFIVRNDASHSDILFKTSDATWQAYNTYSQNFYGCPGGNWNSDCRAFKISYNRPVYTQAFEDDSYVYHAEYPMVRWLEANGYDVTYFTDVDADRSGSLILNHKLFLSNGHDEYWSGHQRDNVEAARSAGVHLAFFSGNAVYWKTRWESSIDGAGVPYRTLVCYKETWADAVIDPNNPPTWTGTWRDPRFSPPADGGRPENALMGTWSRIVGPYIGTITVPQSDGRMRFWRNTDLATLNPGQTATLASGSLGDEIDADEDNGFRPAGLFHLSTTTGIGSSYILLDYGSTVGPGTMVHHLTLYRHTSGSLVFSAGSYNWARGLDAGNIRMQQATVNLFADMGVQPSTRQPGLVPATASTDQVAPNSSFTAPAAGSSVTEGTRVTIAGTAVDSGGGVVGGVEVSTDGGTTWHPATGRESWSYSWKPTTVGSTIIKSRAVDDSGNLESPSAGMGMTVVAAPPVCPTCGFWSDSTIPDMVDAGPDSPVELGLQFRPTVNGTITGVQFYKASTNTGTHVANLWTSSGTLLATATFTGETASGWQQVLFASPVSITANTIYTVSYHAPNGHYSADANYFPTTGADNSLLQAIAGVYAYGATSDAPTQTYNGTNYWVDPLFNAGPAPTLSSIVVTPANSTISTGSTQSFTAIGTYSNGSTQNVTSQVAWTSSSTSVATISGGGVATAANAGSTTISATLGTIIGSTPLTVQATPLTITTTSLPNGSLNVVYTATLAASGGVTPYTWSLNSGVLPAGLVLAGSTGIISGTPTATGTFNFTARVTAANGQSVTKSLSIVVSTVATLWPSTTVPGVVAAGDTNSVELGVKFRSDVNGSITGIRFYKASTNTGTHVAHLWTSTGTLLATATFTGETASGWQQVLFASPVSITANTIYVASYHAPNGRYSIDSNYFATTGVNNPPLHALATGVSGGNGVYAYGATSAFPNQTWNASNYWVDVVFQP
ncbi:MAG: DUF4082 domain-containing protein [Nitrospira sp.]|nr:DUF4082 domain-containing protein [Nitrospira sp.]